MPSGNVSQQTVITSESIRDAFNAIVRPYDADVVFLYSSLVEERLQHPKYNHIGPKSARLHAMIDVITDVMTESLQQARRAVGVEPYPNVFRHDIIANIQADAQANNSELAVLSCYYYRYVADPRIESNSEFGDIVGKSVRDIQRLLKRGLPRIVDRFIRAEHASLRRTQKALILAQLPNHRLVLGRDHLIDQVVNIIESQAHSFTILSGLPGIGKSAIICEAIKKVVENDTFAAFVWVDKPENIANVRQAILSFVEAPVSDVSAFRAFTQHVRILVILDDARLSPSQLAECVYLLEYCHVLMTTQRAPLSTQAQVRHIPIHDLPDESVRALAWEIAIGNGADTIMAEQAANKALAEVGGNPQRIQWFTNQYISGHELITANNKIIQSTLEHDDGIFATLVLLCLTNKSGISEGQLYVIDNLASPRSVRSLTRNTLAYYRDGRFYAEDSIIKLVTSQGQPVHVRQEVGRVVDMILRSFQRFPEPLRASISDSLVTYRWMDNEYWDFVSFITKYHHLARQSSQLDSWLNALLTYSDAVEEPDGMVFTSMASILRRQDKYEAARLAATSAISRCGIKGDFAGLGWGTAELGAIHLVSGHYENAAQALQHGLDYAQRLGEIDLLNYVHSLLAKLFLDLGDYQSAAEHISHVPQSWTTLVLQCEIATQLGRWDQVYDALNLMDALHIDQPANQVIKSAEMVLQKGHLYFAQGLYRQAASFYQIASEKFGIGQQFVKQARAMTNVGACHIQERTKRGEGVQTLIGVLRHQQQLHDVVGMAATQKNLEFARILVESDDHRDERLDEQETDQ